MTKITEIEDRGAATAWSPIGGSYADVIAVGAKDSGGIGFEDTGGELELYDLNMSSQQHHEIIQPILLGSIKTQSRFASLGWSIGNNNTSSLGLLAGGMENGIVNIWNPKAVMEGGTTNALIATMSQHASSGPVKALQFNALRPTQLASAGSDGKLVITNIEQDNTSITATTPSDDYQQHSQLTSVAWNTQVAHIVASSAADGTVAVWDLKSRKAWCELRSETAGQAVSDISWNPTQGLHLVTASADDRNPVLKIWDLRASTSMPLATLAGHRSGILSMAWCPHDDQLLVSCGKDNRTILWDLFTLRPICEVPNDIVVPQQQQQQQQQQSPQQDIFAAAAASSTTSGLASSQQRRYNVQWSPVKRGVISTCSLDRKVQAHSVLGLANKSGRPPKWLRPSSSVSCGFGGTIVSCGNLPTTATHHHQQQQQQQQPMQQRIVTISSVVEQPQLVQASQQFEATIQGTSVTDFCNYRAEQATTIEDAQLWGFMKIIFETNARQQLLDHLGFDPTVIANSASSFNDSDDVGTLNGGLEHLSVDDAAVAKTKSSGTMTPAAMGMVQKALLVGNFEAAVECCIRTGNLADAMILASCGGADLWTKTQQRYFELESAKRPFLSVVKAILHNQLEDLVAKSNPSKWQETLAILSTYGQQEEFFPLCIQLGDLLEQAGDTQSANLCFMCSLSLDRSVKYWRTQLEQASAMSESAKNEGDLDLLALHEFVIKVSTFLQAAGATATLDSTEADYFSKYAQKLAEQGLLVAAAKYSRYSETLETKVLRDRLYRSRASPKCLAAMGGTPPEFPFSYDPSKQRRPVRQAQQQQQQQQQQQVYSRESATSSSYSQQQYGQQQSGAVVSANHAAVQPEAASPAPAPATDSLPQGWMAIQDPSSGRTYYANQSTGEVTWDRPQSAPAPAAPEQQQQHYQQQQQSVSFSQQQPQQHTYASTNGTDASASTPNRLASKYGDGFVSSASHPELASQYGNVGTSNPYSNTERPGTAAVANRAAEKAPVSGTFDPDRIQDLPQEFHGSRDCLVSLVTALKSAQLSPVDKRQLGEAEKGVAVLLKRLARGDIPSEVSAKVVTMTDYMGNHDFRTALSIQTGLVNSDWRNHKDWLKGIKALLQLAAKRY